MVVPPKMRLDEKMADDSERSSGNAHLFSARTATIRPRDCFTNATSKAAVHLEMASGGEGH
jgi:hypothetical protein